MPDLPAIRRLPPRPEGGETVSARAAARALGVGQELIEVMAVSRKIRGYVADSKTGPRVFVDRVDLERVRREMYADHA